MNKFGKLLLSIAVGTIASLPAEATVMSHFEYVGNGHVLTFDLPTQPTNFLDGGGYFYNNSNTIVIILDGTLTTANTLEFYAASHSGGFTVDVFSQSVQISTYVDVMFSGSPAAPTFVNGVYSNLLNRQGGGDGGEMTISQIPEPATLTLLSAGLLGLALVRRATSYGTNCRAE